MRVGILGSGLMGGKLGTLFARREQIVRAEVRFTPARLKRVCVSQTPLSAALPSLSSRNPHVWNIVPAIELYVKASAAS